MQVNFAGNKKNELPARGGYPLRGKFFRRLSRRQNKGALIIEVLIVIAVVSIIAEGLFVIASFSLRDSSLIEETSFANSSAQGAIEAVRNFRDGTDWNKTEEPKGLGKLDNGVAYHPEISGGRWILVLGEETINDFERKIVLEKVSRDPYSEDIESDYNPSNDDQDTRKIIATVSWKNKKVEVITYLTNWKQ